MYIDILVEKIQRLPPTRKLRNSLAVVLLSETPSSSADRKQSRVAPNTPHIINTHIHF
jgi:hypothetical protein